MLDNFQDKGEIMKGFFGKDANFYGKGFVVVLIFIMVCTIIDMSLSAKVYYLVPLSLLCGFFGAMSVAKS
jgi:hypothetical protein